jgi:hypothetical protein
MTTINDLATAKPTCPKWCQQPAGHPYSSVAVEGGVDRMHWVDVARMPSLSVQITAVATAASDDAETEVCEKPGIDISVSNDLDGLTVAEAWVFDEAMSQALRAATDRLQEIQARQ